MNYREKWHRAIEERHHLERANLWLTAALSVSNLCWAALILNPFFR